MIVTIIILLAYLIPSRDALCNRPTCSFVKDIKFLALLNQV